MISGDCCLLNLPPHTVQSSFCRIVVPCTILLAAKRGVAVPTTRYKRTAMQFDLRPNLIWACAESLQLPVRSKHDFIQSPTEINFKPAHEPLHQCERHFNSIMTVHG